jgi:hypothetical protein
MENQKKLMEEHKWIEGQKIGRDPGERACREWIEKYAAQYRKEYDAAFEQIVDKVLTHTCDKIRKLEQETGVEIPPQVIQSMARIFIEQFANEWTVEKVMKPKNRHIDEI